MIDVVSLVLHIRGIFERTISATEISGLFERTTKTISAKIINPTLVFLIPTMIVEIDVVGLINAATIGDDSAGCGCSSGGGSGGHSNGGSVGSGYGIIVDAVASRRTCHPVAGARITRRGGYHGRVIIAVGVDIGGRRTLRCLLMTRQPLLLLLAEHLVGKILDQG